MDIRYLFIRFFQRLVLLSNFIQGKAIRQKKIHLKGDEKILILKGDRIGDAVWSIYMCENLKTNFPNLKISVLSNNYNRFVFEENAHLFEEILSIQQNPPYYLIKEIYRIFDIFLSPLIIFFKNKKLWKFLKNRGFDYTFNLTGRDYFAVANYISPAIGGGLGIFNFLYKCPIIGHNEIGATQQVALKWMEIFDNVNISQLTPKNKDLKNILIFLGGKAPNKLNSDIYQKIILHFQKMGFSIKTLSDNKSTKADFYLSKDDASFMIGNRYLRDFLDDYDLFVGIDGGVLHYCARYIQTLSFCIASNYLSVHPFGKSLKKIYEASGRKAFEIDNIHYIVTKGLQCQGCFLVGCSQRLCIKSLDIEIEIIINEVVKQIKTKNLPV